MKTKNVLSKLEGPVRTALKELDKIQIPDEDAIQLAEALLVVQGLLDKRFALAPAKIRSFVDFASMADALAKPKRNILLEPPSKEPRLHQEPRLPRPPRVKTKRPPKEPPVPYGEYGCWDFPNAQWERTPTAEDIPEIQRQKLQRDPMSTLWRSQEKMTEWFRAKGWIGN